MRYRTMHAALVLAAMAAACGGEPPAQEAETQPAAEAAATACYLTGTMDEARTRPSPLAETTFAVGGLQATLCYGAPSAKGRQIMGGLVPFGEPWRLGANEATAIHLNAMAMVGGVHLQPGSYSLYVIPTATEWTFFINSSFQRWGIPIDDAVRSTEVGSFTAMPEPTEAPVEMLTFTWAPAADGSAGDLVMEWENTRVKIPVAPLGAPMGG